ncbi:hypothetical protein ACHRV5_13155 [Flavobacterium sp. FlaQc-52]|jgi:hypothetical protein|uniref:hypothetical protein n=1 Tax=Flavobacterium sp. FlaQc-52 TaxID=3374185 RepID=UPI0037571637
MLDKISSLFDNYSTKIKNPFIGTIISVWLVHNWRIPFALFNFDKECTMQDKINFIADYFGKQNFWWELCNIALISFLILLISYFLMTISRAITDFFYKIAEPFVITRIDKNAIYTKDEKTKLEKRISILNNKVSTRDEEIVKLEESSARISLDRTVSEKNLNDEIDSSKTIILELEKKVKAFQIILEPFLETKDEFDEINSKLTDPSVKVLKNLSKDYLFRLKNTSDSFLLVSKGLIYDPLGIAKVTENAYNTDEFLRAEFQLTSLGRLFVKYHNTSDDLPL